jgi:hypothetical protein
VTSGTQAAQRAASGPWPERLARLGLAARGVLYVILGVLAVQIAFGDSGEQASQSGALQEVADQPFGSVLLWLIVVGLVGYALWRLLTALLGARSDPTATEGKDRVKALAEGVGYGSVAVVALRIALSDGSSGGGGGGGGAQENTATALSWPGGQLLVGAVGLLVIGVGIYFIWEGWRAKFTDELKLHEVGPTASKVVVQLGRIGRIARGIAFVLIGGFIVAAAVTYDPDKAKGLDGALKSLVDEPYGVVLLVLVGLGLIAYGCYGLAESKLRRVG